MQALLGLGDHQMHSVVVFVGDNTFKTSMPDNVTRGLGYVRYVKSKQEAVLSPEQVEESLEKSLLVASRSRFRLTGLMFGMLKGWLPSVVEIHPVAGVGDFSECWVFRLC